MEGRQVGKNEWKHEARINKAKKLRNRIKTEKKTNIEAGRQDTGRRTGNRQTEMKTNIYKENLPTQENIDIHKYGKSYIQSKVKA